MLVLLHSIITHPSLLPMGIQRMTRLAVLRYATSTLGAGGLDSATTPQQPISPARQTLRLVQTLARRPVAATIWLLSTLVGASLVHEAHDLQIVPVSLGLGKRAFYLGWILLWISPVLAFLTYLGARMGRGEVLALTVGTVWLWGVDT